MNHLDQIAWQREVIREELYDSLEDRGRKIDDLDEDELEALLIRKRKLQ